MEPKAFVAIFMVGIMSVGAGVVLLNELIGEERLVLDNVEFYEKENLIGMVCRNVGTRQVTIEQVLLNYQPHYDLRPYPSGYGIMIPAGKSLGVVCEYEWESRQSYMITIVTSRGNVFSKAGTAPQRHIPLVVEETAWNSTDTTVSLVVTNIDWREQNITGFGISESLERGWRHLSSDDISTNMTRYSTEVWPYYGITIPAGQTGTIVLHWPHYDPWVGGKTYFFRIETEAGPDVYFNSKVP